MENGSERLDKPAYEKFAQSIALGRSIAASYRDAGFEDDRANAHRLLTTNDDIRARVEWLRADTDRRCALDKDKALAVLCRIVMTPVADIDADHFLAQEFKMTKGLTQIKSPSKMDALKLMGQWRGWEKGTEAEQGIAATLPALMLKIAQIRNRKKA